jgi:hypothetical protein
MSNDISVAAAAIFVMGIGTWGYFLNKIRWDKVEMESMGHVWYKSPGAKRGHVYRSEHIKISPRYGTPRSTPNSLFETGMPFKCG